MMQNLASRSNDFIHILYYSAPFAKIDSIKQRSVLKFLTLARFYPFMKLLTSGIKLLYKQEYRTLMII